MGQRRQITACTHAALRRDKWRDAPVQHLAKCVDDDSPHARESLGKGIGAQQHHGSDLGCGQRLAHSHGVRAHQIDLHFANLLARNAHVAEFAYTGRNRVRNFVAGDQRVDNGASTVYSRSSIRVEQHWPMLDSDFPHRFQSKIVAVDVKCFQGICRSAFQIITYSSQMSLFIPIAARNALTYFSGSGTFFISGSTTMCVVSPSASSVPSSARTNSYSNCTRDSRIYFKCVRTITSSS